MAATRFTEQLNVQIGNELAAHNQYLACAVHYDDLTMPQMAAFFYGQAQTFIYYLQMQGKGSLWDLYLKTLILGATRDEAFERVFGREDFAKLEAGWKQAVATGQYGP